MLDLDALDDARLFARPETVAGHEGPFYHAMHVPGVGDVAGDWDLQGDLGTYLGRVDYRDAVVLDIGASDGFLAFEIEKRGATVVTVDLPRNAWPDLFPLSPLLSADAQAQFLERLASIRNAFWFCHRAFASRVRLYESHANRLDPRLTGFDVAVMGNVLQHLRDPVGVVLDLATRAHTIVITEADWLVGSLDTVPAMTLFTSHIAQGNPASWFMVSPQLVEDLLSLAGFSIVARDIHQQFYADPILERTTPVRHYTITATRTALAAAASSSGAASPG